uniref:hypothetical protein n=1 Tax=Candidatus Fimivicinus sp. TaxID=3056640 RepID=UPI003FEE06AF
FLHQGAFVHSPFLLVLFTEGLFLSERLDNPHKPAYTLAHKTAKSKGLVIDGSHPQTKCR